MIQRSYITGAYGCNCHPFASWEECNAAHDANYAFGQRVQRRCNMWKGEQLMDGKIGIVHTVLPNKFFIVQYDGENIIEHAANIKDCTVTGVHDRSIQLNLF